MPDQPVRRIWTLSGSGLSTTLTASGGTPSTLPGPNPPDTKQNMLSPIDLRYVDDVMLSVSVAAVSGTTPTLKVQLNFFDDQGNLFTGGATPILVNPASSSITAAGQTAVFGGRHGSGTTGAYFVLPEWGQIAWTIGGTTPVFSGVEIALYARG